MKTINNFNTRICLFIILCFSILIFGCSKKQTEITYIANEGFLISSGNKNVLVDALQINPWGYESTTDKVFDDMLNSIEPFRDLDLILFSHDHADHFHAQMSAKLLMEQPDLTLVSSEKVVDAFKNDSVVDYEKIADQVISVNPEWSESIEKTIDGIKLKMFVVNHADEGEYKTLAFIIDMNGKKIMHLGDIYPAANVLYFQEMELQKDSIDILFADGYFLSNEVGELIVRKYIQPKEIIVMHLKPGDQENLGSRIYKSFPEAVIFREVLESKIFE